MNQSAARKYFTPWNLLYFGLGLIVLFVLLRQIDFTSLIQLMLKIKPGYLLLGGVIYLGKAITRAARFTRINIRTRPSFTKMLRLSLASSLASQLLPLKLGELSYVYLLKKDNRATVPQGLSTLMVIRIFDLLAISLLFVVIAFVLGFRGSLSVYFYSILVFIGFLLVLILVLLLVARSGHLMLQFFFRFPLIQSVPLAFRIRALLEGVFDDLIQYRPREYLEWTALAVLEWFINYASFHVIMWGMGLRPTFFATVTGVTFAALASVLPINSFGNFGTQEAGWATGLVLLGFTQETAITSGFATHLITLAYMLVFGGIAWLSYLIQGIPLNPVREAR